MLKQAPLLILTRGDPSRAASCSLSPTTKFLPVFFGMLAPSKIKNEHDWSLSSKSTCRSSTSQEGLEESFSMLQEQHDDDEASTCSSSSNVTVPHSNRNIFKRKALCLSDSASTVSTQPLSDSSSSSLGYCDSSVDEDDYSVTRMKSPKDVISSLGNGKQSKTFSVYTVKSSTPMVRQKQSNTKGGVPARSITLSAKAPSPLLSSPVCNIAESPKEKRTIAAVHRSPPLSPHVNQGLHLIAPNADTCSATQVKGTNSQMKTVFKLPTMEKPSSCALCLRKQQWLKQQAQRIKELDGLVQSMTGLLSQKTQEAEQLQGLIHNLVGLLSQQLPQDTVPKEKNVQTDSGSSAPTSDLSSTIKSSGNEDLRTDYKKECAEESSYESSYPITGSQLLSDDDAVMDESSWPPEVCSSLGTTLKVCRLLERKGSKMSQCEYEFPPESTSSHHPDGTSNKVRHVRIQVGNQWGFYSGPMLDGVDEKGCPLLLQGCVVRFENGDIYLGQMRNQCLQGCGTYYVKSGPIHRGYFEQNKFISEFYEHNTK